MLAIPATARLFLYHAPVNMRKSFEGLSTIIQELFENELYNGSFFIFLNRKKDHLKVLLWDGDGFVIWFKRLERGTFTWQWGKQKQIDRKQFLLLLEGVVPKRINRRFSLEK